MAIFGNWKPVAVILTVYFILAVMNILLKKILNKGTNSLVIITYRLIASAIFLTPIACFFERKNRVKLTLQILCYLFFSALLGATLTQYMLLLGTQFTSAAFASTFVNLSPVITFLFALPLGQERVNLRSRHGVAKVLGSFTCICGVVVLVLYRGIPLRKETNSEYIGFKVRSKENWVLGSMFLLLSVICWSAWFLLQSKIGKKYPHKYSSTAIMSLFGVVQSVILCFAINKDTSIWILRGKLQIFTVLFCGIMGSGLCYVGISWTVEQKGPVFTAAFSPSIAIFVDMLDFAFFHEQIYLGSVIGSIIVICGLYILLWGKNREASTNIIKPAEVVECNNETSAIAMTNITQDTSTSECSC